MKIATLLACLLFCFLGFAQQVSPETQQQIKQQIENLRTAHLKSDAELAAKIYHQDLILTSQSGKKYKKEVALKNLKNAFEIYESSDIEFLNASDAVVITNYINERKYKDLDKGVFRLTVVWKQYQGDWKIISMQSSRIKKPK
ncbi:nuclear transport factor 2 family protein [Spongiivirga sp. MCCC 1A20706]|uniref:nuclear transport factor 2 family protein n=1 Tax=Spongiivirga sp. MCCC 1A20706 TaxID=3160963 RepID=UPI0039773E28